MSRYLCSNRQFWSRTRLSLVSSPRITPTTTAITTKIARATVPCSLLRTTTHHYIPSRFLSVSSGADYGDDDGTKLVVSLLGPPNAGKSTLFNRLMDKEANKTYRLSSEKGKRRIKSNGRIGYSNPSRRVGGAIVSSTPGTTRDRRECVGRIGGTYFKLIDTAGVDGERLSHLSGRKRDELHKDMIQQTQIAAKESDLVLLMFDAKVGITSDLTEIARWLRKHMTRTFHHEEGEEEEEEDGDEYAPFNDVLIVGNKLEGDKWTTDPESNVLDNLSEASRVGFGGVVPISAEHGEGLSDIAAVIEKMSRVKHHRLGQRRFLLEEGGEDESDKPSQREKPLKIAILGRQNVGKSTLVNQLLQRDRVISGPTPGLTRDAITVPFLYQNRPIQIVDTAGIRKMSKRVHEDTIEDQAVQDAIRAMKTADVAVLVLDAEARMLQRQELVIAGAAVREGRALVIVANKMDLVVDKDYTKEEYANAVQRQVEIRYPMLRKTPVVAMSSLTGEAVADLFPVVFKARDRWSRVVTTGMLNTWLEEVVDGHGPPSVGGLNSRIKYITQTKGRPPTFLLFCNVDNLPKTYLAYLRRNFQDSFEMFGMEVRMAVKTSAKENPFKKPIKRGGFGVGGREGKKARMVKSLKTFGMPSKKMRRRKKTF